MTKEQIAAIAAAAKAGKEEVAEAEEANADDVAAEPIEGAEAIEADETEPSQPDYEAMLEAERKRADDAEKAAAELAFKARRGKREDKKEEADETEDDDKPMTRAEARAFLQQQGQLIQKNAQESSALSIIHANTSTEAEAQVALQYYKNRIVPTGNLEDDVLGAVAMVNRKRTVAKASELARALKSKDTALRSSASVYRDTGPPGEPKISPQDASAIKAAGMVWDGKQRAYKKPLGSGAKHLYFDPKTKNRWTA